jgi:hypothetical protein
VDSGLTDEESLGWTDEDRLGPKSDYEALGYPETAVGYSDLDAVVEVACVVAHRWLCALATATDNELLDNKETNGDQP